MAGTKLPASALSLPNHSYRVKRDMPCVLVESAETLPLTVVVAARCRESTHRLAFEPLFDESVEENEVEAVELVERPVDS
jgi:hypothetical protein